MKDIPYATINKIEQTIKRYNLFENNIAVVSFSGGKDSLFLCMALLQLGYDVIPITVDVGFDADWSVAKRNLSNIGLPFNLIDMKAFSSLYLDIKKQLSENLRLCETVGLSETICTYCYNSKVLMLDKWAKENHVSRIAFGHHATDALTSFLKSYFMYIDRWHYHNEHFSKHLFESLVSSYSLQFRTDIDEFINGELCADIKNEFAQNHVGTDEPILQYLLDEKISVCRPMFEVFENEIEEYYEGTNCFFNQSECLLTGKRIKNFLTPREMVQYNVLNNANIEICHYLLLLLYQSFRQDGSLLYNVRSHRDDILGFNYKNNHGYNKF